MVDLPAPLAPTTPTRSPAATRKESCSSAGRRPPRIGEGHAVEGDGGLEIRAVAGGGVGDGRLEREEAQDGLRGREAQHALVQHGSQLAQRAEDLDAQHEDHHQRGELHLAALHAEDADRQRDRRAQRDAHVADAARQRVGAEQPHGGL
jgi:hypothetical protein